LDPHDYPPRPEADPPQTAPAEVSFAKETEMKKLMMIAFALSLLMSINLSAQDATPPSNTQTDASAQNSMQSDTSTKPTHITGKISDDGKTFVSDSDGKTWTINNPDAVKGHEGHHVTLKANVSADKTSVDVMSLKMAGDNMKKDSPQN
jgi:hypothetical protein